MTTPTDEQLYLPNGTAVNNRATPPPTEMTLRWNPGLSRETSDVTGMGAASVAGFSDEMGAGTDQVFLVSTYSDFERLAHGPRGTEAKHSLYLYRFHPSDGSLVLLNVIDQKESEIVINPAFSRFHPRLNVVYTCTEDCDSNGQIFAYSIAPNGRLTKIGQADAGGTSTCYLTIDRAQKNMLAVNYWNSTLTVIPISEETGAFTGPIQSMYDPKGGKEMIAARKIHGGVNHSKNDESTIQARQADPHSHALVLDPFVGCIAYVPDLGKDLVREILYDNRTGEFKQELNFLPSGLATGKPDGPRYIVFHPTFETAYVVNELSSTIAVFAVDREKLNQIATASANGESMDRFNNQSTLRLIQSISTLPDAFPKDLNTCGRVCVHPSGRFVIVSNRGHESITIFRVNRKGIAKGMLRQVGFFHTRGETPRHFKFDASGQYLIVANQDSDCISVFNFNLSSGSISFTGNTYHVPSPNFICGCQLHDEDDHVSNPQDRTPGSTMTSVEAQQLQQAVLAHKVRASNAASMAQAEIVDTSGKSSPVDDSSVSSRSSEKHIIVNDGPWFGKNNEEQEEGKGENKRLLAELEAAKAQVLALTEKLSALASSP